MLFFHDFSAKNSKKFVYYNEELVTNSKIQTQLSRKLQRFRICRKNKKCSIFHDLFEYIIFHMIVTYWTGPFKFFNLCIFSLCRFLKKFVVYLVFLVICFFFELIFRKYVSKENIVSR